MLDRSLTTAMRIVALVFLASLVAMPAGARQADSSLRGTVLVAGFDLAGSVFAQSVILIVANDGAAGSLGVAVNRPAGTTLDKVLGDDNRAARAYELYAGGPVGLRNLSVLVRASGDRPGLDEIADGVAFTASAKAFDKLIDRAPDAHDVRFIVGYAGWAPGQLEAEIQHGAWHIVPADRDIIFSDKPEKLWHRLIERIGGEKHSAGEPL